MLAATTVKLMSCLLAKNLSLVRFLNLKRLFLLELQRICRKFAKFWAKMLLKFYLRSSFRMLTATMVKLMSCLIAEDLSFSQVLNLKCLPFLELWRMCRKFAKL